MTREDKSWAERYLDRWVIPLLMTAFGLFASIAMLGLLIFAGGAVLEWWSI